MNTHELPEQATWLRWIRFKNKINKKHTESRYEYPQVDPKMHEVPLNKHDWIWMDAGGFSPIDKG